jgi:hypothetical protein
MAAGPNDELDRRAVAPARNKDALSQSPTLRWPTECADYDRSPAKNIPQNNRDDKGDICGERKSPKRRTSGGEPIQITWRARPERFHWDVPAEKQQIYRNVSKNCVYDAYDKNNAQPVGHASNYYLSARSGA